jgi:RNA-directed DNA polymerase
MRERCGGPGCRRTSRLTGRPLPVLVADLNRHLQGWANYFRYGYPCEVFRAINRYVQCRMATHLRRRSQRPFRPPKGVTLYAHLRQMGLVAL